MSRAPGRGPARFPQPILDARLGDGSRVAICVPPASPHVAITVRRFGTRSFSAAQLLAQGALPAQIPDEAQRVLHTRRNILVSGGTASGNTTLLNVLIALIPDDQRIVTIEDTLELRIDSPNCVRFEARRLQQGDRTTRPHATLRACRIRRYIAPLAVLAGLAGAPVLAQTGTAQVDRVIDGDTISVRLDGDRYTVRFTGVDTPETKHATRGVEPDGPEAADDTTARLTGATVRLDRDPAGDAQDGYGRILRYVMLASGENVNATLIRDGYARTIRTFPYSRPREFLQLEAQARRGRWAERSR